MRAGASALLLLAAACSDITTDSNGVIALDVVSPEPAEVEVGDTIQLVAWAIGRNGDTIPAVIRWRTPDTSLVVVDSLTGAVTGRAVAPQARVQAVEGTLVSDFILLSVVAGADTVEVPDAVIVVDPAATVSASLAARVAAASDTAVSGFAGVPGRSIIYRIVEPAFADPAARTVEITGAALADTVVTGPDGFPVAPVTLSRVAGQLAPDTVRVEVSVIRRSGAPVPGSGAQFVVAFQ